LGPVLHVELVDEALSFLENRFVEDTSV